MAGGGSDQPIVLCGRESRPRGEGVDSDTQPAKETSAGRVGLEELMQPSLQGIAEKARRLKGYRFRDLYRMLNEEMLRKAWKLINKGASAGVDRVTAEEYGKDLEKHIVEVVDSLKRKRYRAKLVRRVNIPKGDGRTRPLGIPTVIPYYTSLSEL